LFLGIDKLLELVEDPETQLVEKLSDRELHNPEGTGLDLRIGKLSRFVQGHGYLGTEYRQTPDIETVAEVVGDSGKGPTVELLPYEYYLATTIEQVNMPLDLVGLLCPRGSLFRAGVVLLTGQINPGYRGNLTFGMFNASSIQFDLEMGARIVHLLVARIDGKSVPYRGQWQGGRIYTNGERQV
jgi:deoxycytidine triphosphate deaminase